MLRPSQGQWRSANLAQLVAGKTLYDWHAKRGQRDRMDQIRGNDSIPRNSPTRSPRSLQRVGVPTRPQFETVAAIRGPACSRSPSLPRRRQSRLRPEPFSIELSPNLGDGLIGQAAATLG